jgi:ABC-type lipoprotein export system ATPase subunit
MAEVVVEAVDAAKIYESSSKVVAVAGATCKVAAGDRIALVGPSGSGKSTLLYMLGGLEHPTSGSVIWPMLGHSDRLFPCFAGFIFQNPNLLDPLTAAENVALPLLLSGAKPENARKAALDALTRMDLIAIADKLPQELSGGQAQRVGIARALVAEPAIVFADEPTGQLDRATADHAIDRLTDAVSASGAALIVATHDDRVADHFALRWRMRHGVLGISP